MQIVISLLQIMKFTIYSYICFLFFSYFFLRSSSCYAFVANDIDSRLMVILAQKTLTGCVVGEDGVPLAGATVLEIGTSNGTVTDMEGKFKLTVADNAMLRFSFMGYKTQEISVGGKTFLNITMVEDAVELDKIVVTALGLEKKEHSLSYAMSHIKNEELTRVKMPNLITSLTGKAAGVQINQVSSGLGASAKVSIRGIRSVAGENQPLYVIDGVPMLNSSSEQAFSAIGGTANAGNRDGGDGISNLNSEDIESISILKGAPAAALYGSQAGNGVILITTKKGKSQGQRSISFSTSLMFDKAVSLPEMQNRYGVSEVIDSWGERQNLPKNDNLKDFFSTGMASITSVSLSHGNEKLQNYFSYANTTGKGIIDKNRLSKHNLTFRETSTLFNDRLRLDGSVNLMRQVTKNKPTVGGFYMNPLVGLYRFPRGEDLTYYKDNFEVYDESRNLNIQNWHTSYDDFEQNPYWIVNRIQSKEVRLHAIVSLSASFKVNDWLTVQTRGNVDCINDKLRQKFYASTAPALAGTNGRYIEMDYQDIQFYGDLMLMMKKQWGDFSVNGALGTSLNDKTTNSTRYDSKTASLYYANVFNLANIIMNGSAALDQKIDARRQLQSLFATVQVGYKESAYIDLTARNDWASTLSHTKHEKRGYLYPSIGTSLILSRLFTLPEWVSYAKVRGAYSMVGNDIPPFMTYPLSHITAGGEYLANDAAPFKEMEPEMNYSWEAGAEARFLNSRIGFNLTFYKTNTRNQFFKLPTLAGDKYAYRYVNAGNILNRGWEIALDATPVLTKDFMWSTTLNFATNKNKIVALHEELKEFVYGPTSFSSSYAMKLVKGGSIGDIYGKAFVRDASGNIVYETEGSNAGLPKIEGDGNTVKVGNSNPKFQMGWNHTLSYKDISLYFLVDCRYGGKVLSQTQADMDLYGVSEVTAQARDEGYVMLEGHRIDNVKGFYKIVGGRAGTTEYYMYDATNIRLRELSLSYQLPASWMEKSKVLKKVQLSFIARNLFFFYKKAPFDPDLVLSTGNDNQGIDVYGMPTTRSWGFSLKCEF